MKLRPLTILLILSLGALVSAQDEARPREGRSLSEATRWLRVVEPEPEPESGVPDVPIDVIDFQLLVREIFEAYERESVGDFMMHMHPGFNARDRTGNDYRYADLPRAVADDFAILSRVRFTVFVGQIQVVRDGNRAQVEIRWSRRLWVEIGGEEILLEDQRSVFQFERRGSGQGFGLSRIFGDSIFGLADRRGVITIDRGTLDGRAIDEPIRLDRFQGILRPPLVQRFSSGGGGGPAPSPTIVTGTFQIRQGLMEWDSQVFPNTFVPLPGNDTSWQPFLGLPTGFIFPTGGTIREITGMFANLDAVTVLPAPPYGETPTLNETAADVGRLFAVRTDQGFFLAFEITAFVAGPFPAGEWTIRFRYQADGSRSMQ